MKSIKNHFSLIIALFAILFSIQVMIIIERSVEAYKVKLSSEYSVIVVSKKTLSQNEVLSLDSLVFEMNKIKIDKFIEKIDKNMRAKNLNLLKDAMPYFYKVKLKHYPTLQEVQILSSKLKKMKGVLKVENFSHNHNSIYKLLLLFQKVMMLFSFSMVVVTTLLIFKELRIWQYKHSERMSIMGLFGAPVWLRSAVLFRLSLVDAFISSAFAYTFFYYVSQNKFILQEFENIGISVVIFDFWSDSLRLITIAVSLSVLLALLIILWHKEEV